MSKRAFEALSPAAMAAKPPPGRRPGANRTQALLALQRAAGNRAVITQVQRCGSKPCDCSAEEREAAEAPVQRVAADFRVTGKWPRAATDPRAIYFDFESSAVTAPDDTKFAPLAGTPMTTVTLKGTASEEERRGPGRATLINDRIAAVEGPLVAGSPGTGSPTRTPDVAAGAGVLDYRSVRRVEILVAGAASSTPVCTPSPDVSCGPAPNVFHTGHARALTLLTAARTALASPTVAPALAPLTLLFRGPANAAAVDSGLARIQAHMPNMLPAIPLHDPAAAGHRCINSCLGADFLAQNQFSGAAARMTLGPRYTTEPDVTRRALTLIHEGCHGATGLTAGDKAYAWQRLIGQLSLADALDNADSYTRLVELIDNPAAASPAPVDSTAALPAARRAAATRTIAWLEQWLVQGRLDLRSLYDEMHPGGAWAPSGIWSRDNTMRHVAAEFGLTAPPAVPTMDDKEIVAGIFDRLFRLRREITGQAFTFEPGPAPSVWDPGPGTRVRLSNGFFALSARRQVERLLTMAVESAGFIEAARKPAYVRLVKKMSTSYGP